MGSHHVDNISRRSLIKGALAAGIGATAMGLAGCSSTTEGSSQSQWWMPETWDHETDVLVVGYGCAGEAAALAAAQDVGADVMVIEAAPEEWMGGNSLASGELILCPNDANGFAAYQTALNGPYEVDSEHVTALAEELSRNKEWLESFGMDVQTSSWCSPEFPQAPSCESVSTYFVDGEASTGALWYQLNDEVELLGIPVLPSTRAVSLIQNPQTKEIIGVKALQNDTDEICIKARKATVLACGGFEANPDMIKTYFNIGYTNIVPSGTPYNRGDGIKMAQGVGADLWHMNSYALDYLGAQPMPEFNTAQYLDFTVCELSRDWIWVSSEGKRFMYEEKDLLTRHGLVERDSNWVVEPVPDPFYTVFGQKTFEGPIFTCMCAGCMVQFFDGFDKGKSNADYLAEGIIVSGETPEELAGKLGIDPTGLAETIRTYNENARKGIDPEFGRGQEIISDVGNVVDFEASNNGSEITGDDIVAHEAFELEPIEGPYYAIKMCHNIINTQGGPKRNSHTQVVDTGGNPIPRLYSAGELGSPYSYLYNGGGNIGDCLASGRIAGRNGGSLDSWEISK